MQLRQGNILELPHNFLVTRCLAFNLKMRFVTDKQKSLFWKILHFTPPCLSVSLSKCETNNFVPIIVFFPSPKIWAFEWVFKDTFFKYSLRLKQQELTLCFEKLEQLETFVNNHLVPTPLIFFLQYMGFTLHEPDSIKRTSAGEHRKKSPVCLQGVFFSQNINHWEYLPWSLLRGR